LIGSEIYLFLGSGLENETSLRENGGLSLVKGESETDLNVRLGDLAHVQHISVFHILNVHHLYMSDVFLTHMTE